MVPATVHLRVYSDLAEIGWVGSSSLKVAGLILIPGPYTSQASPVYGVAMFQRMMVVSPLRRRVRSAVIDSPGSGGVIASDVVLVLSASPSIVSATLPLELIGVSIETLMFAVPKLSGPGIVTVLLYPIGPEANPLGIVPDWVGYPVSSTMYGALDLVTLPPLLAVLKYTFTLA